MGSQKDQASESMWYTYLSEASEAQCQSSESRSQVSLSQSHAALKQNLKAPLKRQCQKVLGQMDLFTGTTKRIRVASWRA